MKLIVGEKAKSIGWIIGFSWGDVGWIAIIDEWVWFDLDFAGMFFNIGFLEISL